MNGKNYQVKKVILEKSLKEEKKISGRLSCEDDFNINFSVRIASKVKLIEKKDFVKEITWWEANRAKFLFSLILSLVMNCLFVASFFWFF
ncbi:hypothetical protein [endosymbiont GvMRE of Glomus versiforme]|uniref:hypothetical protein n=1 Tax=endosymbiont GvMRE of Glomus versiforme TaxID=2039283 RepID=UPI0011C45328|nr:hypothetical protein [endosymbiont GvMRE of Glomus versiforme]